MATIGFRTLALVFGAGYSGTYLYNNIDHARTIATKILLQHQKAEQNSTASTASSSSNSTDINALAQQMDKLAKQVSQNRTDPVIIMGPSGYKGSISTVTDILNLLGWAVVAVGTGGVVYYVAYRKNVSLRDLAWVSQSTFNGTIEAMQQGITRVKGMVSAVKRDLSQRLQFLEGRVDNVRTVLSEQIDREVTEVKDGVNNVGRDVSDVKQFLGEVDTRIAQLTGKLDMATNGIIALVRVVADMAPDRLPPHSPFHELRRLAVNSETASSSDSKSSQPLLSHHRVQGLSSLIEDSQNLTNVDTQPDIKTTKRSSSRSYLSGSVDNLVDPSWRG